ncbi:tetratricopeptide repeat protein [Planctomycetota bacterium]
MKNIQDLVREYETTSYTDHVCAFHGDRNTAGICEKCGKELCPECVVCERGKIICRKCTSLLSRILSYASPWLKNPGLLLASGLLILAALYLLFGGQGRGITGTLSPSFDKEKVILRNRLFLEKGVRLLAYADYLDRESKPSRAIRSFRRAKFSFEEVIKGMEVQFDVHLSNVRSLTEISDRTRFANICIIIAYCCRKESDASTAYAWLKEAIGSKPLPGTLGLAYFRVGLLYEEDMKNPAEAVNLYKKARKTGTISFEQFFNTALDKSIDMLAKPRNEVTTDLILSALTGSADPAEAQYRIIMCYDKLGMKKEVISAYREMKEEYPYSQWTREISRTGMIPEDKTEESEEKETSSSEEEEEEEEKLTITPLED